MRRRHTGTRNDTGFVSFIVEDQMNSKKYYAHISEDGRKQTIYEHLIQSAALAKEFAGEFYASGQGELTGEAHDLGKYSEQFQDRLLHNGPKVDHATAGAVECMRNNQFFAAMAVAGHHSGLLDGGNPGDQTGTFWGRINKANRGGIPPYETHKKEIVLPTPEIPKLDGGEEMMFFTRMLYSCLTDADFLDTEAFMEGHPRVRKEADFETLWSKLQQYIAPWFPPKGELNRQRCAILQNCMEQGKNRNPGLFTLTVPTGGGKTVASLAFALTQAKYHHKKRIVYVIPYTSIIEQTADVFRRILGDDQVLEHHSGVLFEISQEADPWQIRQAKATENWDMPVVVTTAVQFFESLYASRSSKCRKLHNLANSVIIFDEAQMLPQNYLRPCVFSMAQLVKHYGASVVLCTATQPALEPLFREFLPEMEAIELCPPDICQREPFRRVVFERMGESSWEAIASRINHAEQVLCIVNSRKNARNLYDLLKGEGCYQLSTLMCPANRRKSLEEIRSRLTEGKPCKVVSTSLIEAGVDVDFPMVFREEAGLDSVLQAAGRCNREGKRPANESVVTIFKSETPPPPVFRTAIGVGRMVMDHHEDLSSAAAIHAYFKELLEVRGKDAQDSKGIMKLMRDTFFPFQTVAERFRLIETETRTVYIPMDTKAQTLLNQLRNGQSSKALLRQLGQYGVDIHPQHYAALYDACALELLECGASVLVDRSLYNEHTGLSLQADSGQALFV